MNANFERIKDIITVVRQNPVLSDIKGFAGRARLHTTSMTCRREVWYGVPVRIAFEICTFFYNKEGKCHNTIDLPPWVTFHEMISSRAGQTPLMRPFLLHMPLRKNRDRV